MTTGRPVVVFWVCVHVVYFLCVSLLQGYGTPYPGLVRSPSSVGSEGRGEKLNDDDPECVNSLIPAYLNSLKKLMIE